MFETVIAGYRWFFLQIADLIGLGWGIVALSFLTSLAMTPLMKAVAGIVRRESEYQSVILPQIAAIKERYGSDMERHGHIQRLYSRYSYSPLSAIKKVLPLFVQIPFLLLTYFMLKGTAQLSGVSFLFLCNLGKPDALALGVNVLPFAMTAINIVTVFSTPDFSRRDWMQAIGIAFLFLVMLYSAPSALLLYWTLNNLITCLRTLFGRKCAGLLLIAGRIRHLGNLPGTATKCATPAVKAGLTLFLVLWGLFLFFSSVFMSPDMPSGFTTAVVSRGMILVACMASVSSFFLLRREASVIKPLLWFCAAASSLYMSAMVICFLFFRNWYRDSMIGLTPNNGAALMLTLFALPYLTLVWRRCYEWKRDIFAGLVSEWPVFLLPIVLAVHYSCSSPGFLLSVSSTVMLAVYMTLPCVLLAIMAVVMFGKWLEPRVVVGISAGFLLGYFLVPMISTDSGQGLLHYQNNIILRLLLAGLLALILSSIRKRKLIVVFSVFAFAGVAVNAVGNAAAECGNPESESAKGEHVAAMPWEEMPRCVRTNNIYLLVYDGYAHDIVREAYGLNQSFKIEKFLVEKGFNVYNAYSTGVGTIESMSAVFEIGGIRGTSDRSTLAGDNPFMDFLRHNGYRSSYVLCGYELPNRGERMPGDYYFPEKAKITRPENVLFGCLMEGFLSQAADVFNDYTTDEWQNAKNKVLSTMSDKCCFIYAHNGNPGHNTWSPRYRKSDAEEIAGYALRLEKANECIIDDVERLVSQGRFNDSIVIVASDHGGFLTQPKVPRSPTAFEILDREGILMAVHWPKDYRPAIELNCIQNLMLEIMIYLTGDRSLARLAISGETHGIIWPFETPAGLIKNGVIQLGKDRGKSIFDAAAESFAAPSK